MAEAVLIISVQGTKEVQVRQSNVSGRLSDLTQSMTEIGSYLTKFFAGEVFASRGGVIGKPWPPLQPSYEVYKAERWPGRPPMIRTGLLNRSFKSWPSRMAVIVRNTAPYFEFHQLGLGLPQRVMMDVDQARARRIASIIERQIGSIVSRA